ncbi:U32 family peptidase [Aurantimonas sp. E1-2-R+4]|uniref:U32 family peptidase n=1 Tax=Aurantimonas sp. E1-2-R+4 TaxID=3113714 RepID=UPI002F92BC92
MAESELPVEVNDPTALRHLAPGTPFTMGPLVNVYNNGTLGFLARREATSFCLPPELTFASVATLAATGAGYGVDIEVWAFGRLPLAEAGVGALRLSPHTGDMVEVARLFRAAADGWMAPDEALAELAALAPERRFANGFLFGQSGAEWTH